MPAIIVFDRGNFTREWRSDSGYDVRLPPVPPEMRDGHRTLAGAQGHTGYSLLQDPHWHHANASCIEPGAKEATCFVQPPSFLGDLVWVAWLLWTDFTHTREMERLPIPSPSLLKEMVCALP